MRIALANQVDATEFALDDEAYLEALRAAGVEVELAAWDDPGVDWSSYDAVQIRTTWNYHERPAAFADWCRRVAQQTRLHNPAALVAWNANKLYLREVEAAGIEIVPTVWIDPGREVDIAAALSDFGCTRGFLKPAIGANASGTLRFELDADGRPPDACAAHLSEHGREVVMMLQPYLSSVEASGELSLIYFDGVFSHAVRKVPQPGDYRVQDDHGATDHREEPNATQLELGQRCLDFLSSLDFVDGPLLYARIDLMTGPQGENWIGELELIEPSLFFRHDEGAATRLAEALLRRLRA